MMQDIHPVHGAAGGSSRRTLIQAGGGLGIASCLIGLAIFLAVCAGFDGAFILSIIPAAFAVVGTVLTIVGGAFNRSLGVEDTPVLAALFINILAVIGSLLLLAVWMGFPIFARPGAAM